MAISFSYEIITYNVRGGYYYDFIYGYLMRYNDYNDMAI